VSIEYQNNKSESVYSGSSIDEVCLLEMARQARDFGYFVKRDSSTISYRQSSNHVQDLRVLKVFEFTPERRAMSVVVEDSGKIYAFVKGADSTLMKMKSENQNSHSILKLEDDIKNFAIKGWRTLVFGMKEISPQDGQSLENILKDGWDQLKIEQVESNLTLLGATGVEDSL